MVSDPSNTHTSKGLDRAEHAKPILSPSYRSVTIRNPPYTYLHLSLLTSTLSSSDQPPVDILTTRTYLTSALGQFLGLTGTAIPIDFLKVEGSSVWIRVASDDGVAIVGAMSQWVGKEGAVSWRVKARGAWLGAVAAGDGAHLFEL